MSSADATESAAGAVGVVALVNFSPEARWAGVRNLMFGRWPLRREPGVRFGKVLGSGHEGGFVVKPSFAHQGLLAVFDDDAAADAFLERSEQLQLYREHSASWLTLKLRAYASRGRWDGVVPLSSTVERPTGVTASLTRGSIRPTKAKTFWSYAPPAQDALATHPGCLLAMGLGEAPLLRQCTFTLWKDEAALDGYAKTGAHLAAARAALEGGHFSESLFARFRPYSARGLWKGQDATTLGVPETP